MGFEDLDLHRRLTACGARLETIVDAWAIHPNKGGTVPGTPATNELLYRSQPPMAPA